MTSRFSPGRQERVSEPQPNPFASAPDRGAADRGVTIRPDGGPPAPGAQPVDQPGSGLGLIVAVAVAVVVFVLAIYAGGQPSANRYPAFQTTNVLFWFVAVLAIAGAGAGAQYAEITAARGNGVEHRRGPDAYPTAWIVPAISTFAAILLVATFHNPLMMAVGPLVAFFGNAGALLARDLLDDAADASQRSAITVHSLVVHIIAFVAFSAIYLNKFPTPVTATLAGLIAALLTLETLERALAPRLQRLIYGALGGFALAETAIALNWWQTHGWVGGAVLLVAFYLASGILLAATERTRTRTRDLFEYGLVGAVTLVILAITA
ncbi:MAG: hypothetical protein ACKOWF_17180 [Chloroflexota bacterium]